MTGMPDAELLRWRRRGLPPPLEEIRARILPGRWDRLEVGRGWWPLLARLGERLTHIDPRYDVVGIEARDGILHVLAHTETDQILFDDAIWTAMLQAIRTCERCARLGSRRELGLRGHAVLCERHGDTLDPTELDFLREGGGIDALLFTAAGASSAAAHWAASRALSETVTANHLSEVEVAATMGITVNEVRAQYRGGELAGANRNGFVAYPRWQFLPDGAPLPGLARILRAFPETYPPNAVRAVMLRPTEDLGGTSPRQWIVDGYPVAAITALATALHYA